MPLAWLLAGLGIVLAGCQTTPRLATAPTAGATATGIAAAGTARSAAPGAPVRVAAIQARLTAALKGSGLHVIRSGADLQLVVPVQQLFTADALELRQGITTLAPLPQLAATLRAQPQLRLQIRVYTDSIGGAMVNQALSLRRGQALLAEFDAEGITPARLQVFAVGEAAPVASNGTPEGRRQNRRVEFTLLP